MNQKAYKDLFPKMPAQMAERIDQLVQEQVNMEPVNLQDTRQGRKQSKRNAVYRYRRVAALILVLLAGTGSAVYAADRIYRMYVEKQGQYQVNVGVKTTQTSDSTSMEENPIPNQVPRLKVVYSYVPKDYILLDYGDLRKKDGDAYICSSEIAMTESFINGASTLNERFAIDSQTVTVDGHEAVLYHKADDTSAINIFCPEYYQVIRIDISSKDLTEDEIASVIQGICIEDTGEKAGTSGWLTTDTFDQPIDNTVNNNVYSVNRDKTTIYQIGDTFRLPVMEVPAGLTATVKDVTVTEDLSILKNEKEIPKEWKALQTGNGTLKPVELQFIKSGDGKNSLDQVVKTQTEAVKLVDITVQYTNHEDQTLKNILYNCTLSVMDTDGENLVMSGVKRNYLKENSGEVDDVRTPSCTVTDTGEMFYYEMFDDENKNYIQELKPGESVTMHFAQLVFARDVPKLYVNLSTYGTGYCFTEENMHCGFVYIGEKKESHKK